MNTRPNPYVGPRPFGALELLPAREQEILELGDSLMAARILLLHSPSGAGKTSLVEARNGLREEMQGRGFFVRRSMRISQASPTELAQPVNRYELSALRTLTDGEAIDVRELAALGLRGWLDAHREFNRDEDELGGGVPVPASRRRELLIFDQFEELLTTDPRDDPGRVEFCERLTRALEDPYRWALFVIREDYLGALDPWARRLPTLLSHRFRIDLLGADGARAAISTPAAASGVHFDPEALEYLVNELRQSSVQRLDGSIERQAGVWVEPVQLQVVCRRLWSRLASDARRVEIAEVKELGDVDAALGAFYSEQMHVIAAQSGVLERRLRDWMGSKLISPQGIRIPVMRGAEESEGLSNRAIEALEAAHLVRGDERRGVKWFELAHDRLVEPVQADNLAWDREHLHSMQLQAALWGRQDRPTELLLSDDALATAERWLAQQPEPPGELERAFMQASRAARAQERAIREAQANALIVAEELAAAQTRAVKWQRWLTGLVVLLGLLLALFAWDYIVGLQNTSTVQLAELDARNREDADIQQRGAEALLLAQQPGKEREALRMAIGAAASSMKKGRHVPPRVMQGLAAAVATPVQRPIVLRHSDAIVSADFSHDGTRVLTASRDHTAHLWDAVSGRLIRNLNEHNGALLAASFSLDDTRIFTVSFDRSARLWNAASGDLLATYKGLVSPLPQRFIAAMAPDGARAALATNDRSLRLVDLRTSQVIETLHGHTGAITTAMFAPDGLRLATACSDGTARLWAADTGKLVAVMHRHSGPLQSIAFAPGGQRLITVGEDHVAQLWSEVGGHIAVLAAHTGAIGGAVFSPDGSAVATFSNDHTAILWGTLSGRQLGVMIGHTDAVLDLNFSADGRRLVTAGADNTAKVWNIGGGLVVDLAGHTESVRTARFAPDGSRVLTTSDDTTARLWNSVSGAVVATLEGHTGRVFAGLFSPDGTRVLTTSEDNTARLWDASLSNAIPTLKGHSAPVRMTQFSPDGSRIVTLSDDKTARLWDSTNYRLVRVLEGHIGPVSTAVFAGDGSGRMLTLAQDDPILRLWDSQHGELLATVSHMGAVLAATFSRDGSRLISAGADDTLRQWNVSDGVELPGQCQGMRGAVDVAALASGGMFALTASRDTNRASLTADGCVVIGDLVGHSGPITGATFSPDGSLVATISTDNTTKLWSTRYGNNLDTLDSGSGAVHSVVFERDGARLIVATARDAWVYALADEGARTEVLATLQGHGAAVLHARFSPNSRRIVTASSDNTAKLWDLDSPGYELIATLHGHSAAVSFADFSPDGSLVVTAGADSRAKVYPTTLLAFFTKACEALRNYPEDFDEVSRECDG